MQIQEGGPYHELGPSLMQKLTGKDPVESKINRPPSRCPVCSAMIVNHSIFSPHCSDMCKASAESDAQELRSAAEQHIDYFDEVITPEETAAEQSAGFRV